VVLSKFVLYGFYHWDAIPEMVSEETVETS
jgi:hypothetical protein